MDGLNFCAIFYLLEEDVKDNTSYASVAAIAQKCQTEISAKTLNFVKN